MNTVGTKISLFQFLQYECAREFPGIKKISANNLSIDLLISNALDPSFSPPILLCDKDGEGDAGWERVYRAGGEQVPGLGVQRHAHALGPARCTRTNQVIQ